MNIVFMGTPDFAVPSLRVLLEEGYSVVGVVTQPDRPKGRKRVLTPPPVKEEALRHGLAVFQPEKLRSPEAVAEIVKLQPDLIVTAAYGQILPKAILQLPQYGCINVHGSLLPKYRGGAPIQRSIINGEPSTGVTIMYMEEGLDTGDMISRVELPIGREDHTGSMYEKLSAAGAELLRKTLPDLLAGKIQAVPQDDAEATYAPNLSREDERIDWSRPAEAIHNQVRGLYPAPGAFTFWNGEVLKIWHVSPTNYNGQTVDVPDSQASGQKPGTVLRAGVEGIDVASGSGTVRILKLQPAGKKAMDVAQFVRGTGIAAGTVLGGEKAADEG